MNSNNGLPHSLPPVRPDDIKGGILLPPPKSPTLAPRSFGLKFGSSDGSKLTMEETCGVLTEYIRTMPDLGGLYAKLTELLIDCRGVDRALAYKAKAIKGLVELQARLVKARTEFEADVQKAQAESAALNEHLQADPPESP